MPPSGEDRQYPEEEEEVLLGLEEEEDTPRLEEDLPLLEDGCLSGRRRPSASG